MESYFAYHYQFLVVSELGQLEIIYAEERQCSRCLSIYLWRRRGIPVPVIDRGVVRKVILLDYFFPSRRGFVLFLMTIVISGHDFQESILTTRSLFAEGVCTMCNFSCFPMTVKFQDGYSNSAFYRSTTPPAQVSQIYTHIFSLLNWGVDKVVYSEGE